MASLTFVSLAIGRLPAYIYCDNNWALPNRQSLQITDGLSVLQGLTNVFRLNFGAVSQIGDRPG